MSATNGLLNVVKRSYLSPYNLLYNFLAHVNILDHIANRIN